ncbi:MAG: HAD-IIB family hydrolase [Synergistaceae bacterium]|nr:HAD-IIB family hydrolase [Synergistaceae bacterium]
MKYIFFDIDHTLVSHVDFPHIPEQTREAVKLLRENGHVPAIATGRAGFLTFTTAREFEIENIVCSGGAEIFVNGREIQKKFFPDEHLEKFLDVAKKFPQLTAAASDEFIYTDENSGAFRKYFNQQAGYDCVKPMKELKRALMCYIMIPPKFLTPEHGIFYSPPENVKLELMNAFTEARVANTSKWRGIEIFMEHCGADIKDAITFGDGPNDIEMLANASLSVAVASASDKVKNSAKFVCEDIDEGGILKACYELRLII